MTLREVKEFINSLPPEMDDFPVVNGEVGYVEEDSEELMYRVDKPIVALYVDESTNEVCMFHQALEDVKMAYGNPSDTI